MPGLARKHTAFWGNVFLGEYPLRDTLISYLRDGEDIHDFLIDSHKGPSSHQPFNLDRFPGEVFSNCIPSAFTDFVDTQI